MLLIPFISVLAGLAAAPKPDPPLTEEQQDERNAYPPQFELYCRLRDGMTRAEVEALLGKPLHVREDGRNYYLKPSARKGEELQSFLGSIAVEYKNDRLAKASYLGTFPMPILAFESRIRRSSTVVFIVFYAGRYEEFFMQEVIHVGQRVRRMDKKQLFNIVLVDAGGTRPFAGTMRPGGTFPEREREDFWEWAGPAKERDLVQAIKTAMTFQPDQIMLMAGSDVSAEAADAVSKALAGKASLNIACFGEAQYDTPARLKKLAEANGGKCR